MKVIGIYIIENTLNKKVYIGQSVDIHRRVNEHRYKGSSLHRAIKKYGWINFKYLILEECDISIINDRERYYIELYKSCDRKFGYNILKDSDDNPTRGIERSKEVKEKISKSLKIRFSKSPINIGRKNSEESIKKMSIAKIGLYLGENNPFFGKSHTKESISKMKFSLFETIKDKDFSHMYVGVIQINKDTNETIRIWSCVSDAVEFLTGDRKSSTRINSVCRGKNKTALGFKWKYLI